MTSVRAPSRRRGIAVVAHYSDDVPDESFEMLCAGLDDAGLDVITVSTSPQPHDEIVAAAAAHSCAVMSRANQGFDFLSWRRGLELARGEGWLPADVVLTNSSVYGPLWSLDPLLDSMSAHPVWGMLRSREIRDHVQSWWMAFRSDVVGRDAFWDYWRGIRAYQEKWGTILAHELPWATEIAPQGVVTWVPSQSDWGERNPMLVHWRELVSDHRVPFVKRRLFIDTPDDVDLRGWRASLAAAGSTIDAGVIERDLKRRGLPLPPE